MQCVDVVHAVTWPGSALGADLDRQQAAIMLMMLPGMKNGEMRRGPCCLSSSCIASISGPADAERN